MVGSTQIVRRSEFDKVRRDRVGSAGQPQDPALTQHVDVAAEIVLGIH